MKKCNNFISELGFCISISSICCYFCEDARNDFLRSRNDFVRAENITGNFLKKQSHNLLKPTITRHPTISNIFKIKKLNPRLEITRFPDPTISRPPCRAQMQRQSVAYILQNPNKNNNNNNNYQTLWTASLPRGQKPLSYFCFSKVSSCYENTFLLHSQLVS